MKGRQQTGDRRLILFLALVALLAPAIAVVVGETRVGQALERQLYDGWFTIRGELPVPEELVVVAIDEDSEEAFGDFPWDRRWHAHLLRNLHRAGVRAVAFDLTFAVPHPAADSVFRHVIDSTGIAVVGARWDPIVGRGREGGRLEEPPGQLQGARLGIVNMPGDAADGIVREYPILNRYPDPLAEGERRVPQLGIQALLEYLDVPPEALEETPEGWTLGDREIPRGPGGGMLINFLGPWGSVSYRSYVDIIDDAETDVGWNLDEFEFLLEEGYLRDRIVLVGSTIPEHQDLHPTPFREAGPTPGVEIHAQALATILSGNHIRRVQWPREWGWAFLLGLVVVGLSPRFRGIWGAATTVFLAVGALSASGYLFLNHALWLWAVAPILSVGLSYTGSTVALYLVEEREKARIRGMFQQYVASSVVDELIRNPSLLALGGEERVLSVLFSDVVGFSTISENLTPTELVELLNEHLTAMSDVVLKHGGIIDKYQGDALMAEFGAPIPVEDHALRACRAALEMKRELQRLRKKWAREGRPLLEARSGINTGRMLVGNLGSRRIMDYTVMGDHVNLASRLEGTNKLYGTDIMISEFTWEEVRDEIICRELDRIRVKGKAEPVRIYEVVAERSEELSAETEALLQDFHAALTLYKEGEFEEALRAFQRLSEEYPQDGPTHLYVERCREYMQAPPPVEWDGVYTMTTK